jgi:hypothetical protein
MQYIKKVPREFIITFLAVDKIVRQASILEQIVPQNGPFDESNEYYPGQLVLKSYTRDGFTITMNVVGGRESDVRIYNKYGRPKRKRLYAIALKLLADGMVTITGEIE